jgi:hypothetical protein
MIIKVTVPMMLKYRCISAERFAFLEAPILARIGVMHVPIFWPIIIGNAVENIIVPVDAIACSIPIEDEEL